MHSFLELKINLYWDIIMLYTYVVMVLFSIYICTNILVSSLMYRFTFHSKWLTLILPCSWTFCCARFFVTVFSNLFCSETLLTTCSVQNIQFLTAVIYYYTILAVHTCLAGMFNLSMYVLNVVAIKGYTAYYLKVRGIT